MRGNLKVPHFGLIDMTSWSWNSAVILRDGDRMGEKKRDNHRFQEVYFSVERLPLELQQTVVEALQLLPESEEAKAGDTLEGAKPTRLSTSDTCLPQ